MRSSIIIYAIATSWATASALSTHALPAPRNITPKDVLLDLVQRAPHNVPTGQRLTRDILDTVRLLERQCPTRDSEVATKMAGTFYNIICCKMLNVIVFDGSHNTRHNKQALGNYYGPLKTRDVSKHTDPSQTHSCCLHWNNKLRQQAARIRSYHSNCKINWKLLDC